MIDSYNISEYKNQLNLLASVQEYLIRFINNLTIATMDSILLQGSVLSQLTTSTNQLTRDALVNFFVFSMILFIISFYR